MFSLAQSFDAAVGRQAERHTMTVAKAEEPDTSYTEVFDPDFKCYYKVPTICITHVPHTRLNITRLVLCRNYKIGDPSSCTMGQMCKFVHADCDYGTLPSHSVHVNYVWRDESACIYQRLPPGRCFAVHTPGLHDTVEEIASDVLLQTAAFTLVTAPSSGNDTTAKGKLEEKGHVNSNNDSKSHADNNSVGKDALVNGTEEENTSQVCDVHVSESVTTLYHCADFCMNRMCKAGAECRFVHALYIDPTVQLDFRRAPSRVFVGVEVESKKGNKKKIVLEIPDGGGGTMSGNALTTTTSSTESTTLSIMPGRPPRLITTTITTNSSSNSNSNTHHNNVTELSRCSTQSSFSHRGRYVDSTSGNSGGNGAGYVLRRKLSSPSHVEMSSMSAQQVSSTLTRSSHNVSPSHPALSRHASSVMTSLSNTLTGATVNTTPTHNPHSPISSELYGKAAMMPNTTFMPTAFITQPQQQPQQHVLQPYPTQQQPQQYITQQPQQPQQPQGATSCYFSPSPMYPFVQVMPCTTTTPAQQQQVNMLAPAQPQQPQPQPQPSFHHHQQQPQIPHHHHHMMQAQVQLAQPQYVQTSHTIASAQPMYLSGPFPAPMSYVTHDASRPYMTTTNAHTPTPLTTTAATTTTAVLSPPIMYATNTNTANATPQHVHSAVMQQNYLTQPMPVHTIQQQQQQQPQQQQPQQQQQQSLRQPSSYPSNSPTSTGSLPTNTAPVMMMPQNSNNNNQQNTMNNGGNVPASMYYDPAVQGNAQDEKDAVSSSAGPSREIYAGAPSTTVTSSGVSSSSLCTYGMYNAAQGQPLQPAAVQHTAGGQQQVQQVQQQQVQGGMMPYGPRTNASSLASTPTPSTTHALPPAQSRAPEEEPTQSQQQQAEANQQQSMINCPEMPCFVLPNEGPLRPHSTLTESYGSYQATMPAPPQSVSQTRPGTTEPQPLSQVQEQRDEQESQMQSDEAQHNAHDSQGAAMSNMKKARQTRREMHYDTAQDKSDTISQGVHTNTHTVSTSHAAPRQSSQTATEATTATAMTPPRGGATMSQMHSVSPHSPTQQQLQTLQQQQQQQSLTNLNFNTSCISSQPFMMSSTSSASHPFGFTQPFGSQSLHSPAAAAAAAGQTMGIGAAQSNFKGSTSGTAGRHMRRHASANYYPTQGELYGEHPGCAGAMHPRTVSKGSVGAGEQRRPQSHLTQRTQDNMDDVNCVQAEGRDGYVEPTAGQNQSAYGYSNVDVSEMYEEDREAGNNAAEATAAAEEQCYGNTPGMMMTTMYDEPNTSYGDAPMRSHHHRCRRHHHAGKSTQHSSPSPSSSTTARTPSRRTSHHHPYYNNDSNMTNTLATGAVTMYANTSRGSFHAASNQPSAEAMPDGRGGTTNAMMPGMNANESWATTSLTQACPMGLDNNGNNGCTCMQGGDSFMDSTTMPMYDYNESVCSIPPELPNWSQRPSLSVSQQQQQQQQQASSLVDRTNNITIAGVTAGQDEKEQRLGGGAMRMSMSARPAQDNQYGNASVSEATLQRPTPTSRRQRRLSPPRFAASCTVLESNIRHSLTRPYLTSAHSRLPSQHEQHQHNHSYAAFSQTRQGLGGAQSTELREARASLTGTNISGGSGRRVVLHRDEHSASLRPPEMEMLYGGSNTNNNNNIANSSCTSHTGITPCIYTPKAYSPEDVPLVQPQYSAQEESSATVMSMNYREMVSPMERPMNAKNTTGGEQREMNRSSHELLSPARYSPKASSMTYHPSEMSHHFRYEGNTYNNNSSHESTPSRDYYNRSACCVDLRRVQGQPDKARGYGERLQITQSIRSAPVSMTTLPEISAAALGNRLRYRNDPYSAATRVIVSTEQCE